MSLRLIPLSKAYGFSIKRVAKGRVGGGGGVINRASHLMLN